jgi:hypothetical protein
MIALLALALAEGAEPVPSASVGARVGTLAYKGPARHDLRPDIGLWGRTRWKRVQLGAELSTGWRTRRPLEHSVSASKASVLAGIGTGSERVHIGLAGGPALQLRVTSAGDYDVVRLDPGFRMVSWFDLRLGRTPLMLRYQVGSTVRGLWAWDFDAAAGVGVWL